MAQGCTIKSVDVRCHAERTVLPLQKMRPSMMYIGKQRRGFCENRTEQVGTKWGVGGGWGGGQNVQLLTFNVAVNTLTTRL